MGLFGNSFWWTPFSFYCYARQVQKICHSVSFFFCPKQKVRKRESCPRTAARYWLSLFPFVSNKRYCISWRKSCHRAASPDWLSLVLFVYQTKKRDQESAVVGKEKSRFWYAMDMLTTAGLACRFSMVWYDDSDTPYILLIRINKFAVSKDNDAK